MQFYSWVALLVSVVGYALAQDIQYLNPGLVAVPMSDPVESEVYERPRLDQDLFREFKKSFVRPCVYNMGNCITSTQQERLLKHMRSLVALREV